VVAFTRRAGASVRRLLAFTRAVGAFGRRLVAPTPSAWATASLSPALTPRFPPLSPALFENRRPLFVSPPS